MTMSEFDHNDLWQLDGHVTDLGVSFVADGEEERLPAGVVKHVDSCPQCGHRLAEIAELAFLLDAELQELGSAAQVGADARVPTPVDPTTVNGPANGPPVQGTVPPPVPGWGLASGIAIAALAASPSLAKLPLDLLQGWAVARQLGALLVPAVSGLPIAVEQVIGPLWLLSLTAALLLVVLGAALAQRPHSPLERQIR